jgi:hypothetical protein
MPAIMASDNAKGKGNIKREKIKEYRFFGD